MRVLVSGGTGFIGSHVADRLVASGAHQVTVMTRDPTRANPRPGVEYVAGDVGDEDSLRAATRGAEAVLHCVQFPNHPIENPRRGWTYEKVDGDGTERMVRACIESGVARFVYVSGAGVRPGRIEPWFRAKERAERAVMASRMQYVIIRPSWVYGPEDRSLNKFVTFVKLLPVVPVIGSGDERVQPLHVDDLATVVAASVDTPAATNQVFEVGSREPVSMNEILRTLMRVLGKQRPLLPQPKWLVKIPASLLQYLPHPPLSPAAVDFITQEEPVDPAPAERAFGVTFRPLEEGLRTYLATPS